MKTAPLYLIGVLVSALFCAPAAAQVLPAAETEEASLFVESNVNKAEVYLNGVFMGHTPLTVRPVEPGIWQLTVRKDGYYQESYTIKIAAGEQKKITVDLEPVTGTLIIENAPANAEFVSGDKTYRARRIELPEGRHDIQVRAFGYTEKTVSVTIQRRSETTIDGKLEGAPFAVSALRTIKTAFNPDNPSNLGKCEISFEATAPGRAEIRIVSSAGDVTRTYKAGPFTTWKQVLRWDGRDEEGNRVDDGQYAIEVTASGESVSGESAKAPEMTIRSAVTVDGGIFYPFTESFAGTGAAGAVVSGSLMPEYGALIQFDTLAVGAAGSDGMFSPGLSVLAGITDWLEAGVRTGVIVGSSTENAVDVSAGLKAGIARGALHSALALRYSFISGSIPEPGPVNLRGILFGPALEYRFPRGPFGTLSLGGNAEVGWGSEEGFFPGARASVSGGLAVRLVSGPVASALWAHAGTGAGITAGLSAGWIIPSTNLVLSAQGGYQWSDTRTDPFFFRGGFGVMF